MPPWPGSRSGSLYPSSNPCQLRHAVRLDPRLPKPLHTFFILNDHHQIDRLNTDLQTPASARNSNERRRAPSSRRAAGGDTFTPFASEDKTAFDHIGHYSYALCML